jgi:hypothetical protein
MAINIEDKSGLYNSSVATKSQNENSQAVDQSSNDLPISNDNGYIYPEHEDTKSVTNFGQTSEQVSHLDEEKKLDSHGLKNLEEHRNYTDSNDSSYITDIFKEKQAFLVELPDVSHESYFNSIKDKNGSEIKAKRLTFIRKSWVKLTWLLTCWIPNSLFTHCIKTTRFDIQMKWREKVAICILIFLSWFVLLFIGIGTGLLSRFSPNIYTINNLSLYQGANSAAYMYGSVYDLNKLAELHHGKPLVPEGVTIDDMEILEGKDITSLFPLNPQVYCQGLDNIPERYEFDWLVDYNYMDYNPVVASQNFQLMIHRTNKFNGLTVSDDPLWYFNEALPTLKNLKIGTVVYPHKDLNQFRDLQWNIASINGKVYDLSIYVNNTRTRQSRKWIPTAVVNLFKPNATNGVKNGDITQLWNNLELDSPSHKENVMLCLDNLFYVGEVDHREFNSVFYNIYSRIYNSVTGFIKSP